MHYDEQKALQRELNERIPPAPKGDPQNELRNMVHSQRLAGKTLDQSVDFAVSVLTKRYPQFTPRIRPPRPSDSTQQQPAQRAAAAGRS